MPQTKVVGTTQADRTWAGVIEKAAAATGTARQSEKMGRLPTQRRQSNDAAQAKGQVRQTHNRQTAYAGGSSEPPAVAGRSTGGTATEVAKAFGPGPAAVEVSAAGSGAGGKYPAAQAAAGEGQAQGGRLQGRAPRVAEPQVKTDVRTTRRAVGTSVPAMAADSPAAAAGRTRGDVSAAGATATWGGSAAEDSVTTVEGLARYDGAHGTGDGQGAGRPAAADPVPVADQVIETLRTSGARVGQEVVVRLSPPELGTVRITLRAVGATVRAVLQTEVPETLRRLERESAGLVQRLEESGVQVRRLDVVLVRQDGGSATDGGPAEGHGWRGHDGPPSEFAGGDRVAEAVGRAADAGAETEGTFAVGEGALNVRV